MPRKLRRPTNMQLTEFCGLRTVAPQMLAFFELVRRVARSDSSILIRGQTGTGKELVAHAIHQLSSRKDGPFRAVNCATFTPDLLASELFGHLRGSFTGAVRDRLGLFAAGVKGTVFLDEIAEMPPALQARILRVVQERQFVPVGGTDPIKVDVRLVSATHRALRKEVEEGRFREDLMYRLRVVPIFLPPLVDRDGDIEALMWHFISEFNQEGNHYIEAVEEDAIERLLDYEWPGNVRELRNVVEYVFAVSTGPILRLEDLTPELRGVPPDGGPLPKSDEGKRLLEALEAVGGRKQEAAERLGISRSTLWRKLREHGLKV